jgi:hypothetical protein
MFRVVRIGLQGGVRFEIGHQDDVARVVDLADVEFHHEFEQARNQASKALELTLDTSSRLAASALGPARNPPHHYVPDHRFVPQNGFKLKLLYFPIAKFRTKHKPIFGEKKCVCWKIDFQKTEESIEAIRHSSASPGFGASALCREG